MSKSRPLRLKKPTDRCFECGKADGAMTASVDAGNQQHWFHPDCFKKFREAWNKPPR